MAATLYYAPGSASFLVHWLLLELKVPHELRLVDFASRAQKSPEFLAVNPMGKVPALKDGDVAIAESAAICTYVADRYPKVKFAATRER